jgi:ankyrin repeat protein
MQYNDQATEALFRAIPRSDFAGAKKALDDGADPNGLRDGPRNSVLMAAALYNQPEIAELLIDRGADMDYRRQDSETALMLAAHIGNSRVCEVLVDRGANILLQHNFNADAMMIAYQEGNRKLGDYLLGKVKEVHRRIDAEWAQNKADVAGKPPVAIQRAPQKGLAPHG